MEQWRDIEGYPNYQVSNLGRVKSLKFGKIRILKSWVTRDYLQIDLCKDGKHKNFSVHRLVAQAFIPNPELKREVNHINGDKLNNRVENLEWCTSSENQRHALATGLKKLGEERPNAKLTNAQVVYIRNNLDNLTCVQLAKEFGVDARTISSIQRGTTWKALGGITRNPLCQRVPDEIREQIRNEYQCGVHGCSSRALAKKYGVCKATILNIINEK